MLERQVVVPVETARLWVALTDDRFLSSWFGATVRWDLRPGGDACFVEDTGKIRRGVVAEVVVDSLLRFRWWADGEESGSTEVRYELEPVDGGTKLRITETRVPVGAAGSVNASAGALGQRNATVGAVWTAWDTRLCGLWGRVAAPCALVV